MYPSPEMALNIPEQDTILKEAEDVLMSYPPAKKVKTEAKSGARVLPDGWTYGYKPRKTGNDKDKVMIAPDGTMCDRWGKVQKYLATH